MRRERRDVCFGMLFGQCEGPHAGSAAVVPELRLANSAGETKSEEAVRWVHVDLVDAVDVTQHQGREESALRGVEPVNIRRRAADEDVACRVRVCDAPAWRWDASGVVQSALRMERYVAARREIDGFGPVVGQDCEIDIFCVGVSLKLQTQVVQIPNTNLRSVHANGYCTLAVWRCENFGA